MGEAFEEAGQWSGAATETESVDEEYYNLVTGLEDIKDNLDKCSKSLFKCHSSAASSNRHFIGLRSDLTRNANVYVDLNFLLAVQVVTNLQDFFMQYSVLDFKQFKRHIKVIDKSIGEQAKSAAVLSKVNSLLLSDLHKLQLHADRKLKHIEDDARAQRKIASDALKDSNRLKEKCDAEKEEYENEEKRCETEKREYEAEKVRCDEMRKVHEAEKRKFDAEKLEHEAEKRRWDAQKDKHQLEEMKCDAEKMEHEEERIKYDLKKQKHDEESSKWKAEETMHAAVQRECDADKKEYDERVECLKIEKYRAGNTATAGVVVGGLASVGAAVLAAPALVVAATVVGGAEAAAAGFTLRNYAQDQEQKATSKGLRAVNKGEEAKKKGRNAAEQGRRASENARRAAENGQRAAEKGRSAARDGEIAAMNGRRAAEKEEIAKANAREAAEAAAISAATGRRAAENEKRSREMAEDAAKKANSAAAKARRATARGKDLIAEGERVAEDAVKEADECSKAVKLIEEDLMESLKRFINALDKITGYMAVLAKDIKMYAGKISDGRQMKMHLGSIKKFESKIVKSCDAFVRFHTTVQAKCSSIRTLDQGLDAADDEPGVNDVHGWCSKHKASGGLQLRELAVLQWHLGSESVGNLVDKRANYLQKVLQTMSFKKKILNS